MQKANTAGTVFGVVAVNDLIELFDDLFFVLQNFGTLVLIIVLGLCGQAELFVEVHRPVLVISIHFYFYNLTRFKKY